MADSLSFDDSDYSRFEQSSSLDSKTSESGASSSTAMTANSQGNEEANLQLINDEFIRRISTPALESKIKTLSKRVSFHEEN
jgi:hypothetical protein